MPVKGIYAWRNTKKLPYGTAGIVARRDLQI